jgi:hypothetical protein
MYGKVSLENLAWSTVAKMFLYQRIKLEELVSCTIIAAYGIGQVAGGE